jgi:hypothetical protein
VKPIFYDEVHGSFGFLIPVLSPSNDSRLSYGFEFAAAKKIPRVMNPGNFCIRA